MKYCKNCKYFTGVYEHGWNECFGECKKTKNNTLYCFDDTPCLQDKKTLIELYYKNKETINIIEFEKEKLKSYKEKYEIKCRHLDKLKDRLYLALTYIPKEKAQEFNNKAIERWFKNEEKK